LVENRLVSCEQVEFEAIKSEYTNAQLECNAADERAKLLASEVIGLEEKVLIFLGIFAICTFEDKVFPVFFFFFFFSEIKLLIETCVEFFFS